MIKKLRRKFVLINMLLVTVVLCIVLGMLIFSRMRAFRRESEGAMRAMLQLRQMNAQGMPPRNDQDPENAPQFPKLDLEPGGRNKPFNATPVFLTILDENQEIADIVSPGSSEVTENLASEAVKAALFTNAEQGYLSNLKLRFLMQQTPDGLKIAFADTVQETRSLHELILACILVLLLALLCFLVISIFLARWALRPVENAWEQQNQFIADASHELKTPLTVILANLRILLSHPQSTISMESKWLENTQSEAQRMKELVEKLLFLARSDANSTPFVSTHFSLSDLAWSCLLTFEPVAFEHGITISEEITDHIFVTGDSGQLKQLLAILLDNACKYADNEKKVTVTLKMDADRVLLKVCNTGAPIPPEALPHLFERFYRTDKSRARLAGGYGLGLSIAHTIVKNHRGKIAVASDEVSGTSFTVTLPASRENYP